MSNAKETDFFRQVNILLTNKNKKHLDELKSITTLSNNISVDNSTFIRAMIEYLADHKEICTHIKRYIVQSKGSTYATKFEILFDEGKSPDEIADILGVERKLISKIFNR